MASASLCLQGMPTERIRSAAKSSLHMLFRETTAMLAKNMHRETENRYTMTGTKLSQHRPYKSESICARSTSSRRTSRCFVRLDTAVHHELSESWQALQCYHGQMQLIRITLDSSTLATGELRGRGFHDERPGRESKAPELRSSCS